MIKKLTPTVALIEKGLHPRHPFEKETPASEFIGKRDTSTH